MPCSWPGLPSSRLSSSMKVSAQVNSSAPYGPVRVTSWRTWPERTIDCAMRRRSAMDSLRDRAQWHTRLLGRASALPCVADVAGQRQVPELVAAATEARDDVVDLAIASE